MHQENIFRNFGTFKTKDDFLVRLDGLTIGPTHDEYTLLLGHPSQVENYDGKKLKEIKENCPPCYPVHFAPFHAKPPSL